MEKLTGIKTQMNKSLLSQKITVKKAYIFDQEEKSA